MRVGQAKELFRALTQQYFGGANVVFANQSRTAKQKVPLVVLTPGNVHRPQGSELHVRRWRGRRALPLPLLNYGGSVHERVSGRR